MIFKFQYQKKSKTKKTSKRKKKYSAAKIFKEKNLLCDESLTLIYVRNVHFHSDSLPV